MEPFDRMIDRRNCLSGEDGDGGCRPTEEQSGIENENAELRRKLSELLDAAAENERIWRHFVEMEKILFRTRDLNQLVEELLLEIKERFEPDHVTLLLCHQELIQDYFPAINRQSIPIGDGTWIVPCRPGWESWSVAIPTSRPYSPVTRSTGWGLSSRIGGTGPIGSPDSPLCP